jgi:hypothetical protein
MKPVGEASGVEEGARALPGIIVPGPGVQVGGIFCGVGVSEGSTIPTGKVGGGKGFNAESGLKKTFNTIADTPHNARSAISVKIFKTGFLMAFSIL